MKHTKKIKKTILIIGFMMISTLSFAQLPPGFDNTQNDTGPAPISSIISIGLLVGAFYGVRKLKK